LSMDVTSCNCSIQYNITILMIYCK
jgi:hypothetical protein